MSSKVSIDFGGVFLPLLTILFIGLKLTGYINWSWWWVLAPIWIPVVIAIIVLMLALLALVLIELVKMNRK